ncbi:MAG: hypothetical protein Q8876_04645 [Bacillota bacterium]|nr:hypothetical protein [Bacillota bacterium]
MKRLNPIFKLIVLLICFLTTISMSFSWFSRQTITNNASMTFTATIPIRCSNSSQCTVNTYLGTANSQGIINYDTSTAISFTGASIDMSKQAQGRIYYRTDINNSSSYPITSVSLFFDSVTYTSSSGTLNFALTGPTKTYKSYSSGTLATSSEPFPIVRNITVSSGSTVSVYWYFEDTSKSGTLALTKLYFCYN